MWSGNLAPDHADLGAADLLLASVDIGDLLASIEAIALELVFEVLQYHYSRSRKNVLGSGCAINTLDLDQAGARVGDVTRALVAQVTSPMMILR